MPSAFTSEEYACPKPRPLGIEKTWTAATDRQLNDVRVRHLQATRNFVPCLLLALGILVPGLLAFYLVFGVLSFPVRFGFALAAFMIVFFFAPWFLARWRMVWIRRKARRGGWLMLFSTQHATLLLIGSPAKPMWPQQGGEVRPKSRPQRWIVAEVLATRSREGQMTHLMARVLPHLGREADRLRVTIEFATPYARVARLFAEMLPGTTKLPGVRNMYWRRIRLRYTPGAPTAPISTFGKFYHLQGSVWVFAMTALAIQLAGAWSVMRLASWQAQVWFAQLVIASFWLTLRPLEDVRKRLWMEVIAPTLLLFSFALIFGVRLGWKPSDHDRLFEPLDAAQQAVVALVTVYATLGLIRAGIETVSAFLQRREQERQLRP